MADGEPAATVGDGAPEPSARPGVFGVTATGVLPFPVAVVPRSGRAGTPADVKVVVDSKSLELIDGTEVDYVKEGLNEAFKFRNPNVKGECGCGESFSV